MANYVICADGACSGNPGPGGYAYEVWATCVADGNEMFGGSGSSIQTTNNIMELRALICALDDFGGRDLEPGIVKLRLDSEYVLKGAFEWLDGWKARGWKTAGKKPVANAEMWQELDVLLTDAKANGWIFEADWVKGHEGDMGNERVDTTAQLRRDEAKLETTNTDEESKPAPAPTPMPSIPEQQVANPPHSGEITPAQVEMLRSIIDPYVEGDASIKAVLKALRENAHTLGM